ncbi:MAG: DUF2703 domain-containing protein [Deltaproteobacteria bacterium]|nr:DUF2703 domain-containing protein [Deltaproteobacteria bacterium]
MKQLEIEWRHLDKEGNTCSRCSDTGAALNQVVASLATECAPYGWEIALKETKLTEKEIDESNMILVNGMPIEKLLPDASTSQSHCASCCDVLGGESVCCRTIEYGEQSYEAIPARLIRQAICAVAQCC